MMRVVAVLALVLAGSGVAEARKVLVGKGIKGGMVAGIAHEDQLGDTDPFDHLRLGAGVFLHVRGKQWGSFALDGQVELMLSWKGGRVPAETNTTGPGDMPNYELSLFYIEMPLLVRVALANHVWLLAGPTISYYAGGWLDDNIWGDQGPDGDYPANRVSGGFTAGLGFSTGAERGLGLELRYTGASDVAGYADFKGLQTFCVLVSHEFR